MLFSINSSIGFYLSAVWVEELHGIWLWCQQSTRPYAVQINFQTKIKTYVNKLIGEQCRVCVCVFRCCDFHFICRFFIHAFASWHQAVFSIIIEQEEKNKKKISERKIEASLTFAPQLKYFKIKRLQQTRRITKSAQETKEERETEKNEPKHCSVLK